MRVENDTLYPSAALRRIFEAVHARESARRGWSRLTQWDRLVIRVRYARRGELGGWAVVGGQLANLFVPRRILPVSRFASLWRHELWHLYGFRHGDMPDHVHDWTPDGMSYVGRALGGIRYLHERQGPK